MADYGMMSEINDALELFMDFLFGDPELVVTTTYHSYSDLEFSESENRNATVYVDRTVGAIEVKNSIFTVIRDRMPINLEGADLLIRKTGAPPNMTPRDKITYNGELRGIKTVDPDLIRAACVITLESEA